MTLLTAFKHKQILVLGAGLTGMSCARYLASQDLCFAVNDSRSNPFAKNYSEADFAAEFTTAKLSLGQWNEELISNADVILISPGIDSGVIGLDKLMKPNCHLLGDVELFCQVNNQSDKPIQMLAVTGSNGKSTVVSLLDYLAKQIGVHAQLGGNIGQPVLDLYSQLPVQKSKVLPEVLIAELSSFQLETLNSMKAISGTVLNVSDDHLDRHHTIENYQAIKQHIYKQSDVAIINRDDIRTATLNADQRQLSFGSDEPKERQFGVRFDLDENQVEQAYLAFGECDLIALSKLPLAGMHNALNYLAALALGYSAGWSLSSMIKHLAGFNGLAHRCQRIISNDNIIWINDSKATNVGATLAAINGLAKTLTNSQRLILIAGGESKGADFTPLIESLEQHVFKVITLGKDGDKIEKLANKVTSTQQVEDLHSAVKAAKSIATSGDIVLLSPACASIDMFQNFAKRGEAFISAINSLSEVNA